MLKAIRQFFAAPPHQEEAHRAYVALVAQARSPAFYQQWEVPDTVDGRFDVIVLHVALVVLALRREGTPEALEFSRTLSEIFFSDMDRSLREMGSTDTGTGMRVKNMAQAFYGRLQAYGDALESDTLKQALARNLYREKPVGTQALEAVARYAQDNSRFTLPQLLAGELHFSA